MERTTETNDVLKRFNSDLMLAIEACHLGRVFEILSHAPGVVSVMDGNLNILVFFSTRLHTCNEIQRGHKKYAYHAFKKIKIGTLPFFIKSEGLRLEEFLRSKIALSEGCSWLEQPERHSSETQLAKAA